MASILVVDDEVDIGSTIEAMLSGCGHNVQCESDPDRIRGVLKENYFDLIISDVFMPYFNGIELTLQVKEENPKTKVLLMTGGSSHFPSNSDALRDITGSAEAFGANAIINKPFKKSDLIDAVNGLV